MNIEQTIKSYILKDYKEYLSNLKVSFLNDKKYTFTNEYELLYKILDDLIETNTKKQINNNIEDSMSIPYGETLKNIFIEYLIYKLNIKYNLNIKQNDEYSLIFEYFNSLNQYYENLVEINIFTKNAIELENDKIMKEIAKYYNNYDLIKYNIQINSLKNNNNSFEQINIDNFLTDRISYYQDLITKYSKGQKLTQEELKDLSNTNIGYTIKSFALYIVLLTIILVAIIIVLIIN